ncbi:MAG: competence/damage-inducible protein A, partial [Candidatus Methylomirabilis sp.]|nr:competence/damage-inducible protein A [Deltaproteobacteria bacterium]
MPKAAILTIGDELTSGRVVNSNAAWIAQQLMGLGIETPLHFTIVDSVEEIVKWLGVLHEAVDVVVCTGGLGPTEDDLTTASVAKYAGVPLELNEAVLDQIRAKFTFMGMEMPPNNERQAMLPKGARIIENWQGTAVGSIVEKAGKWVAILPGVPREMKPMVIDSVVPFLRDTYGLSGVMKIRTLKTFGFTESKLGTIVQQIPAPDPNLRIGYRPSFPEIHLSLTALAPDERTADAWIAEFEGEVRRRISRFVWGADADEFAGVVGALLKERKWKVATAESCTGGLVSKMLTDIPGSSDFFERGFVTYSNEAKRETLGVDAALFKPGGPGAVSEECVLEMAALARAKAGTHCALSLSGIAGPTGGSEDKPVGTVWIGLATPEGASARLFTIPGTRDWV